MGPPGDSPHSIEVCIVKRDNNPNTYAKLAELADGYHSPDIRTKQSDLELGQQAISRQRNCNFDGVESFYKGEKRPRQVVVTL